MDQSSWAELEEVRGSIQCGAALLGVTALLLELPVLAKALLALLALRLAVGSGPYWLLVALKTFPRDVKIVVAMLKIMYKLIVWEKNDMTVAKVFFQLAKECPDKIAFHAEEKSYTFREIADLSMRVARVLSENGVERGRVVAVILGEKAGARFVITWLALAIIGCPAALLPPKARHTTLLHAIRAAVADMILFSDDAKEAIEEICDDPLIGGMSLFQYNFGDAPIMEGAIDVITRIPTVSSEYLSDELNAGHYKDPLFYIYTSGTTGLPKAAIIRNSRYLLAAKAFISTTRLTGEDSVYCPLPLHHTAGGILGVGSALIAGATVVLRNKFSASNYFKDCVKYKCTAAQYIGEMCRYMLVAQEASGNPVPPHSLRFVSGNGLRSTMWKKFQSTFNIPAIYEFYGATEGNTNLINMVSHEGAVGFLPRMFSFMSPICLVKCDVDSEEPVRDENGFFIQCKPNEPGLLLGKLNHNKRLYTFTGYVDEQATKKKIFCDVFEKGDCWFNSGDILSMDHLGFFYFKDRTGDTFRWKSENVSTIEVESVIIEVINMTDVVVFGVEIPNTEGKAGMAVIVDKANKLDLDSVAKALQVKLPPHARPLFIRVMDSVPMTTTFKIVKTGLRKDGYDPGTVKDRLYFLDQAAQRYVPLTESLHADILNGKLRL